jgi:hypothetical protein
MEHVREFRRLEDRLLVAIFSLVLFSCSSQKQDARITDKPAANAPTPAIVRQPSEEWRRYRLADGEGDVITVLLPETPKDFPGGKFKTPSDAELPAHLYLLSREATHFFAAFVDLPKASEGMTDSEREEIFFGCWRGIAGSVQEILQQKFGGAFDISSSEQKIEVKDKRERRAQDFRVGSQQGRAQIVFAGQRAYLLAAIWNPDNSESAAGASRFLDSFQVEIPHK